MYHCYLVPYIKKNGKIFVLIGKKLCYSSKDGFVHNNAGQWVFIGGGCNRSKIDNKLIKSAIREFVEETGNYVNINNTYLKKYNDFTVTFYRVSTTKEYNIYKKLNPNKKDKWKEIRNLKWVEIDYAIKLMDPKIKNNEPCDNKFEQSVHKYIRDWSSNGWVLKSELKNFKRFLEGRMRTRLSIKDYEYIREEIRRNLKRSENYGLMFDHMVKVFKKRAYTDWFYTQAKYLKKNIEKIDKDIQLSINIPSRVKISTKTKSPPKKSIRPKKKSPPKKSKSPPKKPVRKFQVRRVAIKQSPEKKQNQSRFSQFKKPKSRRNNRW